MSNAVLINYQAFQPYKGGEGIRKGLTTTSGSLSYQVLGADGASNSRIIVTNSGTVACYVRLGRQNVIATTGSLEILANSYVTLTPPYLDTNPLYIAGCTEGGTTSINVMFGYGT